MIRKRKTRSRHSVLGVVHMHMGARESMRREFGDRATMMTRFLTRKRLSPLVFPTSHHDASVWIVDNSNSSTLSYTLPARFGVGRAKNTNLPYIRALLKSMRPLKTSCNRTKSPKTRHEVTTAHFDERHCPC